MFPFKAPSQLPLQFISLLDLRLNTYSELCNLHTKPSIHHIQEGQSKTLIDNSNEIIVSVGDFDSHKTLDERGLCGKSNHFHLGIETTLPYLAPTFLFRRLTLPHSSTHSTLHCNTQEPQANRLTKIHKTDNFGVWKPLKWGFFCHS